VEEKRRSLELTKEEVGILTTQISARIVELDHYIKAKVVRGLDFEGPYELKKKLATIRDRLYEIL
jgi:hypothetical protein